MQKITFIIQKISQKSKRKLILFYPGIMISTLVGLVAYSLGTHYGAPIMLFALLIGMAISFLTESRKCKAGIQFTSTSLLKLGVGFLGVRIVPQDLMQLKIEMLLAIPLLITFTLLLAFISCKIMHKSWHFALLTGGAVGICGASAALAMASIIPQQKFLERNTLFVIIGVTTLSTVAMVAYPILFSILKLNQLQIGFLLGATIHDVAQVVGAGYSVSESVGDTATLVKILRVCMLPVVIFIAIFIIPKQSGQKYARIPWFVVIFLLLALLNSFSLLPALLVEWLNILSRSLLIIAISALGIKSSLAQMAGVKRTHIGVLLIETLALLGAALAFTVWFL